MRALHAAATITATAALALGLTACSSSGSSDSSADPTASAASTASTASATGGTGTTGGTSGSTGSTGSTSTTGGSTGGAAKGTGIGTGTDTSSGTSRCHTSDLAVSFGTGDGTVSSSDDQQKLPVVLKNKGTGSCTLQGFPGVDLKGGGTTWSLTRSSVATKKVTLAPGTAAQFTITFLPWTEGSGTEFKATTLVITPPNETSQATVTWPGGSILLQDGATHPGTYVGPIGS
jgi:hypothetical protein